MTRWTASVLVGACLVGACVAVVAAGGRARDGAIDRRALVSRHDPVLNSFDRNSPLSVGNGEFAFTADVTGLQTFAEAFEQTTPLGTLSQWGWHTAPNPSAWSIDTFRFAEFDSRGRKVGYADIPSNQRTPEIDYLRANPHRLHLGRLALRLVHADGSPAVPADLSGIDQRLDLWNGELRSHFVFDGTPVDVVTLCHPALDAVAVRVESPLVASGRLGIALRYPYGTGQTITADWTKPSAHVTTWVPRGPNGGEFQRALDADRYGVSVGWAPSGTIAERAPHDFLLTAGPGSAALELVAVFSASPAAGAPPAFDAARQASRAHWNRFWSTGGAIDLSGSADPRWRELERRIVLSQYLTAIQCAGSLPPQETGLTYNSWEGKFHLEMHWWHAAQFALWGRLPLLEKSLGYYGAILPVARATAARQGYSGARWPKMTSPGGAESPSSVGPFLAWQQPHPIFYAELVYRLRPGRATLDAYRDVVFETARFMASFPGRDERGRLVLGPPLQCAQETYPKDRTVNCTYELSYWRWGLQTAQAWRERLGMSREPAWDEVLAGLAPLPTTTDGRYLFAETAPDTFSNPRWATDHPSVLAAYGVLPGPGVDPKTMRATWRWIWEHWNWPSTWGWDYPMLAMASARLGDPERAVDALLLDTPKNVYWPNGHNYQRPGLTIYLPGNGGLLYAAAMMAAGWDGAPAGHAPGFPQNGRWTVRWEGLHRAP